jgi:hypothetical protein
MAKWSIDPAKFCKSAIDKAEKVRQLYAFEIFKRIVMATPVDIGAASSNWIPSTESPSEEITDSKNRNQALQKIKEVIAQVSGDDSLFLANNLSYTKSLEYGWYGKWENGQFTPANTQKVINGFSRMAAHGMVGVTMAQAERIFQAAVNAVKGSGT